MRNVCIRIINKLIHVIIVFAIISIPLYYVIGKGDGYFFSIYDIYKEVLVESVGVLLLGLYCLRLCFEEKLATRKIKVYLPLILFTLMNLISFTQMINHYEGWLYFKRWACFLSLIFVVANFCTSREQVRYYLGWMVSIGALVALYGTAQYFNIDFPFLVQNFKGNATDGNPNFVGEYMTIIFPITFWITLSFLGSKRSIFYIICTAITANFILLNRTKAAWVGLGFSAIYIVGFIIIGHVTGVLRFALDDKQKAFFGVIVKVFLVFISVSIVMSALTFIPQVKNAHTFVASYNDTVRKIVSEVLQFKTANKLFTPEDKIDESTIMLGDTTMQRILIWRNTLKMVKQHLWLGVGLGNFKIQYQPYRSRKEQISTGPDVFVRRTHNDWLQCLAELGIPGFAFFLMILAYSQYMAYQIVVRSNNFYMQTLTLGFAMAFMAMYFTAIFGFPLHSPNPSFTLWLLLGLFAAYHWIIWCKEDLRSAPVRGSRPKGDQRSPLLSLFKKKEAVQMASVEPAALRKKTSGKKSAAKVVADPYVGMWVFPDIVKLILMPLLVALFIFGLVSHHWIWKPAHAFYNRQFGQALQRMGRHDKAKILFEKSIKDEPYAWETHFLLANELAAMNQHEAARREHEFSLKLNPYHAKGHYNLANTLNRIGDVQGSLHHYRLAVEYDNMLYQAYLNLGAMCFQNQEFEQCIEFYKMSIAVNPEFFSAYYNLAYALCATGKIGEAIPYVQKAKELEPGNPKIIELEDRIKAIITNYNNQQAQQQQQQQQQQPQPQQQPGAPQ